MTLTVSPSRLNRRNPTDTRWTDRENMIALAALIALCLHLQLGWWTAAAVLVYLPILSALMRVRK